MSEAVTVSSGGFIEDGWEVGRWVRVAGHYILGRLYACRAEIPTRYAQRRWDFLARRLKPRYFGRITSISRESMFVVEK